MESPVILIIIGFVLLIIGFVWYFGLGLLLNALPILSNPLTIGFQNDAWIFILFGIIFIGAGFILLLLGDGGGRGEGF